MKGRWPSLPNVGTGVAVDATASAREGLQGGFLIRERSFERADERCRSVRQRCVDLTPQCLASSLAEVQGPDRAGVPPSVRRRGHKRPIPRGERVISRRAIAQGMSDVLRCPVCSCAQFLPIAHGTAGAARIRHSLLPHWRENDMQKLGQIVPRDADAHLLFEIRIEMSPRDCEPTARSAAR
jgi:hypothetical protein